MTTLIIIYFVHCLVAGIFMGVAYKHGYKQGRKDVIELDQKTKPTQSDPEIDTCKECSQIKEIWTNGICEECTLKSFKYQNQ